MWIILAIRLFNLTPHVNFPTQPSFLQNCLCLVCIVLVLAVAVAVSVGHGVGVGSVSVFICVQSQVASRESNSIPNAKSRLSLSFSLVFELS